MLKNVIDALRDEFLAAQPNSNTEQLDLFCSFAKKWLADKRVIGVGQAPEGFAIRLADMSEFLLTSTEDLSSPDTAVGISGSVGRSDRTVVNNSSVNVTGR